MKFSVVVLSIVAIMNSACSSSSKKSAAAPAPTSNSTPVLWTAKESVNAPESAYYHLPSDTLYVSNVNGTPIEKDGNGYISKYTITGQIVEAKWVTGLNAPKGQRAFNDTLWVTDIDQVVVIDIKTGKIKNKINVKGAKFLNDIGIDEKGTVYVSDMVGNKIYTVKGKKVSIFKEGADLEGPNGLFVANGKLFVAGWGREMQPDFSTKTPGHLYSLDLKTKEKTLITQTPLGNLDGLELTKDGSYFVSDWVAGRVYKVAADGKSTLVIEGLKGAADLGWDQSTNTVIVPRMLEGQVSAYTIQ